MGINAFPQYAKSNGGSYFAYQTGKSLLEEDIDSVRVNEFGPTEFYKAIYEGIKDVGLERILKNFLRVKPHHSIQTVFGFFIDDAGYPWILLEKLTALDLSTAFTDTFTKEVYHRDILCGMAYLEEHQQVVEVQKGKGIGVANDGFVKIKIEQIYNRDSIKKSPDPPNSLFEQAQDMEVFSNKIKCKNVREYLSTYRPYHNK